ncbi:MAG: hypothetical protein H0U02_07285, partial [Rubrobacter sp.]|nr:hypothetical protein [Rubrobacter sp.]
MTLYALNLFDLADNALYREYSRHLPAAVKKHGGRVVALGRLGEALDTGGPEVEPHRGWLGMLSEEVEESLPELLGLLDVRRVPAVFDHLFPVAPAILDVRLEHGACLGDHRLRGIHFLPRPPRHHSYLAEVAKVQERGVGDERVVCAPD